METTASAHVLPVDNRPAPGAIRLWPAVVILVLQWLIIKIPALLAPATPTQFMGWFMGSLIGTALLIVWLLFFSKLKWADRLILLAAFALGAGTIVALSHPSIG